MRQAVAFLVWVLFTPVILIGAFWHVAEAAFEAGRDYASDLGEWLDG